ncbi:aminotransferase class I/II-fold pyridoxal phosphate-dependent enzyme [bacterium]|nr:aminotransferase class I/II-fold pyridoxal phosphate-dependent enzyme [bacterium]
MDRETKNTPAPLDALVTERLKAQEETGVYRRLRAIPEGHVDFASNDYLGLIQSGALEAAFRAHPLHAHPHHVHSGAGGSRLISGELPEAASFERELAEFHGGESALIFSSGYDANLALITALGQLGGVQMIYDEKIHASMRDGFRLARCRSAHFRHNSLRDLEAHLERSEKIPLVFVESTYSMDGDCAPLPEIQALVLRFGGSLIIDEAHSTGISGEMGCGRTSELLGNGGIGAAIHTWGKAFGSQGAVVCCSSPLRELMVNFGRSFIYTTGISRLHLSGARVAYRVIQQAEEARRALAQTISTWNREVAAALSGASSEVQAIEFSQNESPIQYIRVRSEAVSSGEERRTLLKGVAEHLLQDTLYVVPIFHPTVSHTEEMIRISLHAFNSEDEVKRVLNGVQEGVRQEKNET